MHFTPTNILRLVVSTAILGCLAIVSGSIVAVSDEVGNGTKRMEVWRCGRRHALLPNVVNHDLTAATLAGWTWRCGKAAVCALGRAHR